MLNHSMHQWNDKLKQMFCCPACEAKYDAPSAHVLQDDEGVQLLHITCPKCTHAMLALVRVGKVGASSVGLVTDLSYEDAVRVREEDNVTTDDVLAAHVLFGSKAWQHGI